MLVSNSATAPTVSALERSGTRVTAVHTGNGERIGADAVVLTTELPDTYRLLGRTPRTTAAAASGAVGRRRPCRMPRGAADDVGHHTILFGQAWQQTFRDIIDDGQVDERPVAAGHPTHRRRRPAWPLTGATCSMSWLRRRIPLWARSIGRRPGRPTPTGCSR